MVRKRTTIESTKISRLASKKGYGKRTYKWKKRSTVKEVENEKKKEVWLLTGEQAYGPNDYGVYVHSTSRNFVKALNSIGLLESVSSTISAETLKISKRINSLANEIKPTDEMRKSGVLELFVKDNTQELFDAIKDVMLSYSRLSAVKAKDKFIKRINNFDNQKYASITKNKKTNEWKVSYIKTKKTSILNFTRMLKDALPNQYYKNESFEKVVKKFEESADTLGEIIDEDIDIINNAFLEEFKPETSVSVGDINVDLTNALSLLKDILTKIVDNVSISNNYRSIAASLMSIKDINEFIDPSKKSWAKMGNMYEALVSYTLSNKNLRNELVGESGLSLHNTTDISINDFTSTVNGLKVKIGASLKNTINFSKTSNKVNAEGTTKKGGFNDLLDSNSKIMNQYKYFILNYSILSDLEDKNRKSQNLMKVKGGRETTKVNDVNLMSYVEIIQLYKLFSFNIGRLFLVQNLLGNIIMTGNNPSFKDKGDSAVPFVLVTQDYAVFTYDILNKLEDLLMNGVVGIDLPTHNFSGDYKKLVYRKRKAILEPGSDVHSYSDLLEADEVKDFMEKLYNTAFKSEEGVAGDKKIRVPGEKYSFDTTINMALLVEKIQSARRS